MKKQRARPIEWHRLKMPPKHLRSAIDTEIQLLIYLGWWDWHTIARLRAEIEGVPGH